MAEFFFRTEDLKPDEVLKYFVETRQDRKLIDALKSRNPVILVGSRGVGKSFLLRVTQAELFQAYPTEKAFPVYVSFIRSSLLYSSDPHQFKHWMLARICSAIMRAVTKEGLLGATPKTTKTLLGDTGVAPGGKSKIEAIADQFEETWRNPASGVDVAGLPSIDEFKEAVEDLCEELGISRIVLLVDEAAHIFLPEQQRQFFTLFRDLRSHNITCNAAVYPGVTSYGETFQPAHDATMLSIDRDILATDYIDNMREIVERQADSHFLKNMAQNRNNFSILAYAACGNPRILLKTLSRAQRLNSSEVNEVVREYYRSEIWAEHSMLAEKYIGHRPLIDWGRQFIEAQVLPEIKSKNDLYLHTERNTSAFFWVHRDAPEVVKEALRVLAYTGIVNEHAVGIKASRAEIGKRYMVNLGCVFALEPTPAATSLDIARMLAPKRMTEYGSNHATYKTLTDQADLIADSNLTEALENQLNQPISVLDISEWQKEKLLELGLATVRDVLNATESKLKEAYYVGDVRARRMRNAAVAAVLEYLSG